MKMEFERVRDGSGGMVGCERGFGTVGSEDGSLRLGKCDGAVAALRRFGGDGVVSGSEDGLVRLWDVRREVEVGSVEAHDGPVTDVRVCEFERLVYSSGDDGFVKVWDVRTGRCVREFHAHNDPCSQIALLGNDKFASAGVDGAVWVWSTASGERIAGCQVDYAWPVWCIKAFDARHVISGAHDGVIRVLDVQSGRMSVLKGHAGRQNLEFRDDGRSQSAQRTFCIGGGTELHRKWTIAFGIIRPLRTAMERLHRRANVPVHGRPPRICSMRCAVLRP